MAVEDENKSFYFSFLRLIIIIKKKKKKKKKPNLIKTFWSVENAN